MCPVNNIHLDNINPEKNGIEKSRIEDKNGNDVSIYTVDINKAVPGEKDSCFGLDCIVCLKCYNLCPYDAVLIGEKSRDTKRYRRYKGPSADFKPVVYR